MTDLLLQQVVIGSDVVVSIVPYLLLDAIGMHACLLRQLLQHILIDLQFQFYLLLCGGRVFGLELATANLLDGQSLK